MENDNNKSLINLNDLKKFSTVSDLTKELLKYEQPDIHTVHNFKDGKYYRTFFPSKDMLIVGKIHKTNGINFLIQGNVTIYEDGDFKVFSAPHMWEAPKNSQKVGLFHENSIFMSVTDCKSTEVEAAELELFYPNETTIEQVRDWESYEAMKNNLQLSEEKIQEFVNLDNLIEKSPLENYTLGKSEIHGVGFFTNKSYKKGETIGKALISSERTELGRWVNHSHSPNSEGFYDDPNNSTIFAIKDIKEDEEITISYLDNMKKKEQL